MVFVACIVWMAGSPAIDACGSDPDDPSVPFQALVVRDRAPVFSGPGQEHYTTNELPRGGVVEVIRFDPGGWIAIAPDGDEFSLIPESAVEWIDEWRATVNTDGLHVWVGTRTGAVEQPLWQVKLRRGDEIEVLGRVNWPSPEGFSTVWLQVVPPEGELRWMRRQDLQFPDHRTRLPNLVEEPSPVAARPIPRRTDNPWPDAPPETEPSRNAQPRRAFVDSQPASMNQLPAAPFPTSDLDDPSNGSGGWRRATQPIRLAQDFSAASMSPEDSRRAGFDAPAVPSGPVAYNHWPAPDPRQAVTTPTIDQPLTDRLRHLDMQIGLEIVKPAEHWQLMPLVETLQQIQASATSDVERQQAYALRTKLDRLRATQEQLVGSMRFTVAVPTAGSNPIGNGLASPTVMAQEMNYDAVGWLNELVQNHGAGQTTYVLQDDQGRITHHVSPSPGLNLHRYLKTKVGLRGARGFHQRFNVEHITADRIVVLERAPTISR